MKARFLVGITLLLVLFLPAGAGMALTAPHAPGSTALDALEHIWHTIDADGDVGSHVAVAYHPHTHIPYVSYYDADEGDLRFARPVAVGGNCGPGNSWKCEIIDDGGDVGMHSSIDIYYNDSPLPLLNRTTIGVAYYDANGRTLKYAKGTWAAFSANWQWQISTIEGPGVSVLTRVGRFASLKFDSDGAPHIGYLRSTPLTGAVKYATRVGGGGNCGPAGDDWQCDVIDNGRGVGFGISLDVNANDTPRLAYFDGDNDDLKYAAPVTSLGNCGPGDTWSCSTIDAAGSVGEYPSLHASDHELDTTRIAYYDAGNGMLKYAAPAAKTLVGGNCGPMIQGRRSWRCVNIDDIGVIPPESTDLMDISLAATGDGVVKIAYHDLNDVGIISPKSLKLATYAGAGALDGNCGPGDSWFCETLDDGRRLKMAPPFFAYHDVGGYAAIDMRPAGLAAIAYYDEADGNLLVIEERALVFTPLQMLGYEND